MVAGAAISVNVASVAGEILSLMVGWQDGIVCGELVIGLVEDLHTWLGLIAQLNQQDASSLKE